MKAFIATLILIGAPLAGMLILLASMIPEVN